MSKKMLQKIYRFLESSGRKAVKAGLKCKSKLAHLTHILCSLVQFTYNTQIYVFHKADLTIVVIFSNELITVMLQLGHA
jgi:hypothetical protein